MAAETKAQGIYAVPDDGNEDSCGACRGIGVLICCENCPAAYHTACAGYKDEDDIPGGEDDAWLCWSCARDTKTPFAHTNSPLEAKVGDWVMLAVREGAITYHKAKVTAVKGGKVVVRHNDLKGTLEEVPTSSPRLWHGTLDDKAWERKHNSYMPISRAYGIDTDLVAGANASRTATAAGASAKAHPVPDLKRKAPAEAEQPNKAPKLSFKPPDPSAPAARGTILAQGLGAGLPPKRGPSLPARPVKGGTSAPSAARPSKAAARPPPSGLAERLLGAFGLTWDLLPAAAPSRAPAMTNGTFKSTSTLPPGVRYSSGAAAGSAASEGPSRTDFRRAYLEWLKRQGDSAERSRQFYGDSELDLFLLWTRVAQYGGLKAVGAIKAWAAVGREIGLPESLEHKSKICRRRFKAARLDDFTQACILGQTGIKLPTAVKQSSQPRKPKALASAPASASAPAAPAAPANGKRVAQHPQQQQRPPLPQNCSCAADPRVVGWTEVVKDHSLKPGIEVEARCFDGPFLGGWHSVHVMEVAPGSMWEGGLRVHVELSSSVAFSGSDGCPKSRRWLPLVHAPANSAAPAAVIRLPPRAAHVPSSWAVGQPVEGCAAGEESWWPGSIHAVLPKGYLQLRLEPTSMHPEGEIWEVHSSMVRPAPGPEQQFVLLYPVQDCARMAPEQLRHKLAWQQHFLEDDWVLESYSREESLPRTAEQLAGLSARLSNSDRQPVASSLQECLERAAKRPQKRPLSGAAATVHDGPALSSPAGLAEPYAAQHSSHAPAAGRTGTPQHRSSSHEQRVQSEGRPAPYSPSAAMQQPARRSLPAAFARPQSTAGPRVMHAPLTPRPSPTAPRNAGANSFQSPIAAIGMTPAVRPRLEVSKLIPMAGRTGKLAPVRSSNVFAGHVAKQKTPQPQTPMTKLVSKWHVWPSKSTANDIPRLAEPSGSSSGSGPAYLSANGTGPKEHSSADPMHASKDRNTVSGRSRLQHCWKNPAMHASQPIHMKLPPLGPRFGIGRVEHAQKAGTQVQQARTYPRINFSAGIRPPHMQTPILQAPEAADMALRKAVAPAQAGSPAGMSRLVAALQFSPHFSAAPRQ